MSGSLGALVVSIEGNVAKWASDMGKMAQIAETNMRQIDRSIGMVKNTLATLGVGLAGGGFVEMIKGSIELQAHLVDLNKTTGISVEQLSGLSLVAKTSGGDLDSMAKSIDFLSKNIGKTPDKFRELGITAKDPLKAFEQLADILTKIPDIQERNAVAQKSLGKAWETAMPALMLGGQAIDDLAKKGTELSGVTDESARQAKLFDDKIKELETSLGGILNRGVNPLLPQLINLANYIEGAGEQAKSATSGFSTWGFLLKNLAIGAAEASFFFKSLGENIYGNIAGLNALAHGDLKGFHFITDAVRADIAKAQNELFAFVKGIDNPTAMKPSASTATSGGGPSGSSIANFLGRGAGAGHAGVDKDVQAAQNFIDKLIKQSAELGMTKEELLKYEEAHLKLSAAQKKTADSAIATIQAFDDQAAAMKRAEENAQNFYDALQKSEDEKTKQEAENSKIEQESIDKFKEDSIKAFHDLQPAAEQLAMDIQAVKDNADALFSDHEEAVAWAAPIIENMKKIAAEANKTKDGMDTFAKTAAKHIQTSFADFLFDPFKGGLKGMLTSFEEMLRRMAAEAAAADLAKRLFGSVSGGTGDGVFGGLLKSLGSVFGLGGASSASNLNASPGISLPSSASDIFGGFKAGGGSVDYNKAYVVGEQGPEIFMPGSSGTILPNGASGKPISISQTFVISGPTDIRTQKQLATAALQGASRALHQNG